ncbi:MAG TPA: hypothetical protein VFU76_14890 [Terriglobales bacterium]|nr:hypothetical protein [Terriglobales bacterium]
MTNILCRPGRLFCCLISLLLAANLAAQPTKTLITDTLYRADGSPAAGTLLISWPAFTAAEGKAVAAGSITVPIGAQGAVSLQLVPTQNATPPGTYYRVTLKLDDGTSTTEYWTVPAQSPTTIAAIRSTVVPASVALQVASREYVDSAFVHKQGDESVAGVKTFGASPLVPTPSGDSAAANKQYVDDAVLGVNAGTILTISKGGTGASSFTPARCVRVAADGNSLESSAADCNTASDADTVDGLHAAQLGGGAALHAVKDCSLPADGASDIVPALAACEAAHPAASIAFPAGRYRVGTSHTIPRDVAIDLVGGAELEVDAGVTLSVDGGFTASATRHFTGAGTVTLPGTARILPEWYGAKGDGVTDDAPAIQAAIDANPGRTILFTKHKNYDFFIGYEGTDGIDYRLGSRLLVNAASTSLECGSWNGAGLNTSNGCSLIVDREAAGGIWFQASCFNCSLRGINVVGHYYIMVNPNYWFPTLSQDGVLVTGPYFHCSASSVIAMGRHGFYIEGNHLLDGGIPDFPRFDSCAAIDNQQVGLYIHGADANQGTFTNFNAIGNNHLGIQDDSQLGNVYIAPHANANGSMSTWDASAIASIARSNNVVTVTHAALADNAGPPAAGNAMTIAGAAGMTTSPNGTFLVCGPPNAGCVTPSEFTFSYQQSGPNETGAAATGTVRMAQLNEIAASFWNEGSGASYIGAYSGSGSGVWIQPYTELNQGDGVHGCVNFTSPMSSIVGAHFACGQGPSSLSPEFINGTQTVAFSNTNGVSIRGGANTTGVLNLNPGKDSLQAFAINWEDPSGNTTYWQAQGAAGGDFHIQDYANNVRRLTFGATGDTGLSSSGSGVIRNNWQNNSGTGGWQLWSGGPSPTGPVVSMTNTGNVSARQYTSTVAGGTAPLVVASSTAVANLNADLLDNKHAADFLANSTALAQTKVCTGSDKVSAYDAATGQFTCAADQSSGVGGGTTLQVEGAALAATVNFNATTPAAETGYVNAKLQKSAGGDSVSIEVPTGTTLSTVAAGNHNHDSAYVASNGAISGATRTKITYDAKGLVTSGADATTADIAASVDKNYVTDAQQAALAGTSGTPGTANRYVTDGDSRLTDARVAAGGNADTLDTRHASDFLAATTALPQSHSELQKFLATYDAETGSFTAAQPSCGGLSDSGNACVRSVGTTAGTVATGDHGHTLAGEVSGALASTALAEQFKKRPCEVVISGSGASGLLQDTDDVMGTCVNLYGAMLTLESVACYADSGAPTVMVTLTGGADALTGNLTCSTGYAAGTLSGTPTQSYNASVNLTGKLDVKIVAAGGAAHEVHVIIGRML